MADIPKDFSKALKTSGLAEFFSSCPPSHRREYLKWIAEAKRPETRKNRIQKAMKTLSVKRAEKSARPKKTA
ncbi:MAG TPA: YdeI/OmpD-associated family protein [Verrucomicrobiae bacterium]|nr:YdeI/OmpD-associated family protein [Verrucomicrobiae bacterium]